MVPAEVLSKSRGCSVGWDATEERVATAVVKFRLDGLAERGKELAEMLTQVRQTVQNLWNRMQGGGREPDGQPVIDGGRRHGGDRGQTDEQFVEAIKVFSRAVELMADLRRLPPSGPGPGSSIEAAGSRLAWVWVTAIITAVVAASAAIVMNRLGDISKRQDAEAAQREQIEQRIAVIDCRLSPDTCRPVVLDGRTPGH